jgi:hypothetical protein
MAESATKELVACVALLLAATAVMLASKLGICQLILHILLSLSVEINI